MPSELPGNPAALRAGAARLRAAGEHSTDAARRVTGAQQRAADGWSGAAHGAFDAAAGRTAGRVGSLTRLADAAEPLLAYADELERLQRAFAETSVQFDAAWAATTTGPPSAQLDAARNGLEAQSAALDELRAQARAANERAASAIAQVAQAATDEMAGARQDLADGALSRGVAINGTYEAGRVLAAGATGASAYDLVSENMSRTAQLGDDVMSGAQRAGFVVAPSVAGLGQALDDSSNPYFSTGERAGRVAGQGLSVGGAAIAGGVAGAALGSVVPGVGTVVGGIVGAAGATIVGYYSADWMDEHNDGFVDVSGEFGDVVGDGVRDLSSW